MTSLEPAVLFDAMAFVVDFHRDDTVLDFLAGVEEWLTEGPLSHPPPSIHPV